MPAHINRYRQGQRWSVPAVKIIFDANDGVKLEKLSVEEFKRRTVETAKEFVRLIGEHKNDILASAEDIYDQELVKSIRNSFVHSRQTGTRDQHLIEDLSPNESQHLVAIRPLICYPDEIGADLSDQGHAHFIGIHVVEFLWDKLSNESQELCVLVALASEMVRISRELIQAQKRLESLANRIGLSGQDIISTKYQEVI